MTTTLQSSATDSVQFQTPTPPCLASNNEPSSSSIELPPSYEELQAKNEALEMTRKNLQFQLVTLQEKNDYWTRLYTYVEKGIAIKIKELTTSKGEIEQLKVSSPLLFVRYLIRR
jgi:hypothetical protein